jgi:hypothetical protein
MKWILKKFWLPISLVALHFLAKKYPWAAKLKGILQKF